MMGDNEQDSPAFPSPDETVRNLGRHPDRETIAAVLRHHSTALHRDFGVSGLVLFGSAARGEAGPRSDIDLLVDFDAPPGLLRLGRLKAHLESILGRRVDLATRGSISPELEERIRADGRHVL